MSEPETLEGNEDYVVFHKELGIYPPFKKEWLNNNMSAIIVDVPWKYRPVGKLGGLAETQYPCLTIKELKLLKDPIDKMAADDCALFFWATSPKIMEAGEIIEHWGFDYRTILTVWVKTDKKGEPKCGLGMYTRSCCEYLLLGVRGNVKKWVKNNGVLQLLVQEAAKHSAKPDRIFEVIEAVFDIKNHQKIELFARQKREGWAAWGNDPSLGLPTIKKTAALKDVKDEDEDEEAIVVKKPAKKKKKL